MTSRRRNSLLLAAPALLLGAVIFVGQGCVVTSGVPGDGGSGPADGATGDGADGAVTIANACNECLFQGCTGQWSVCQQSAECAAIYQCATAPGCDQACVDACYLSHPTGKSAYYSLALCNQQYTCTPCDGPCAALRNPAACGGADAAPPADASGPAADATADAATVDASATVTSCTDCTAAQCPAQRKACGPDSDCDHYTQCVTACTAGPASGLATCIGGCDDVFKAGSQASGALGACVTANCTAACAL